MAKTTRRRAGSPRPSEQSADLPQPVPAPETSTNAPTHDQISERAYERYVSRGGAPGSDLEDWFEAERDLRQKG